MNILDLDSDALESVLSRLNVVNASCVEQVSSKLRAMRPVHKLLLNRERFRQSVNLIARLNQACHKELGTESTAAIILNELADVTDSKDIRRELAHAGLMAALTRAFKRWPINSVSTHNAAATLWNLTAGNVAMPAVDMVAQLVDEGAVERLVKLITCKLPESGTRAAKFAMMVLSNAMSNQVQDAVAERVERAARAMGLRCGLYPKLVNLLKAWTDKTDAHPELTGVKPVLNVIWGLANRGESALHLGSQPDCFESLLRLANGDDAELRFSATGVLLNLLDWRVNADRFKAVGGEGVNVLSRLMADNTVPPSRKGDEKMEIPADERCIAYLAGIAHDVLDEWGDSLSERDSDRSESPSNSKSQSDGEGE